MQILYRIITHTDSREFVNQVQEALNEGWRLQGGMSLYTNINGKMPGDIICDCAFGQALWMPIVSEDSQPSTSDTW